MPLVFKFLCFRFTWLHRAGRVYTFQRLNSGFLIHTDNVCTLVMEPLSLMIQLAYFSNFLSKFSFVFYFVIQPVFMPMRLEVPLILKNARYYWAKSLP